MHRTAVYLTGLIIVVSFLIPVGSNDIDSTEKLKERENFQQDFLELYDAERFQQSILPAKQVVSLTEEIYGEKSFKLITPLNNLASAYFMIEDFENAQSLFLKCIELIEVNQNIISPESSAMGHGQIGGAGPPPFSWGKAVDHPDPRCAPARNSRCDPLTGRGLQYYSIISKC